LSECVEEMDRIVSEKIDEFAKADKLDEKEKGDILEMLGERTKLYSWMNSLLREVELAEIEPVVYENEIAFAGMIEKEAISEEESEEETGSEDLAEGVAGMDLEDQE